MTDIFDVDGTQRDAAWLAATWDGCEVLPARIPTGATEYWRLAAIYCTTGPAVLKVEVRRGVHPANNQPVVLTWPALDNPSQDLDPLPSNAHNWTARGVVEQTPIGGMLGFGLGAAYGPYYSTWVLSSVPSDCLAKAGMKGGTEHSGPLHAVFVLTPVSVVYASLDEALHGEAQSHQAIQFNPMAALQKRADADGFTVNSPEFDLTFGGVTYRAQRAEHQASGVVRCYYVEVPIWTTVKFIEW